MLHSSRSFSAIALSALMAAGLFSMPVLADTATVAITDYAFTPATITVHPGDKVTWNNGDSVPHTATALDGKSFDTGTIDPGSSASVTFSRPGTYEYRCAIHPDMHGAVDVK